MKIQKWFCKKCWKIGEVKYQRRDDVHTVLNRIGWSHREVSPGCDQPVTSIMIKNETKEPKS
jgi:hypothetical protein